MILFLFLIVCIVCLFAKRPEPFTPVDFYGQFKYAQNFNLVEFNDKFFNDALKNSVSAETIEGEEMYKYPSWLLEKNEKFLAKILNDFIKEVNPSFFSVAHSELISVKSDGHKYIVESKHIVHRDGKIYGASIYIKTALDDFNIALLQYKLLGFIFEDRIKLEKPYNLDTNEYQYYMLDKTITKGERFEKDYLCKYYKERDIPTELEC